MSLQPATNRRIREDGQLARAEILQSAAQLATVEGLEGLSIARIAEATGRSKSGVFAHFKSKLELQLATVDAANAIYEREVFGPTASATSAIERLRIVCRAALSYFERRVFLGGCFFVSSMAEFRARKGPVQDRLIEINRAWMDYLRDNVAEAQSDGDLDPTLDPGQVAFELNAFLETADVLYWLMDDPGAIKRAGAAIDRILDDRPRTGTAQPNAPS